MLGRFVSGGARAWEREGDAHPSLDIDIVSYQRNFKIKFDKGQKNIVVPLA